jgi:hypothetical protein
MTSSLLTDVADAQIVVVIDAQGKTSVLKHRTAPLHAITAEVTLTYKSESTFTPEGPA